MKITAERSFKVNYFEKEKNACLAHTVMFAEKE